MFVQSVRQIFRSLWKYKGFTLINLLGLSVGIAAVLLIFLIFDYEKSFDQFHGNRKDIYRVVTKSEREGKTQYEAAVPYPTGSLLRSEYPGLLATEIHHSDDVNVRIGTLPPFQEKHLVFADSLFFSVFNFAGIKNFRVSGDPVKALSAPGKAILTQSTAKKYFGDEDPIGKIIRLDAKLDVVIAAVVKDIPPTSHLPFSILVSYATLTGEFIGGFDLTSWGIRSGGYCYVRTDNKSTTSSIERALYTVVQRNAKDERDKRQKFYLQPLNEIHFDPDFDTTNPVLSVSNKYLWMLSLLGVFIILIACTNYINLSTSMAFSKSKEVGIRKTIGASRMQLFFRYMSETFLLTMMAAAIGIILAGIFLPLVNGMLDKSVSLLQLVNIRFVSAAIAGLILVSFISGIYPALIMSGFRPIESLKSQLAMPGRSSTILRRVLVVFQFSISIALIICTIVIADQMHYFNSRSLGFNKDAVVEVQLPSPDSAKIEAFRSSLQNQSGIKEFSFCLGAPISDNGINTSMKAPELPEKGDYSVKIMACDRNYLETYGIKLIAGRWFLQGEEKKLGSGMVVNEALVKTLGYKNPSDALGKTVSIGINEYKPPIIGVVQDFHTTSLHKSISPVALLPFPYFYYATAIRINPGNAKGTLSNIETAFRQVYPDYVFQVSFIDDQLAKLYDQETRNYNLFKAFSVISIFICCIGLWGLIAFVVVRKTKEIGIRKVLGASIASIVALLSRDFLMLVFIALFIASPVSWYFMHQWLENFAYRVGIGWWVFAAAGLAALVIALLTISFQAVKAALANPVKNLRSE
jgi:putative ABC transport system permease protein